jgi:hypothetical protein
MRQLIGVCSIVTSACLAVVSLATPSMAGGTSGASSSITFTVQDPDTPLNVVVIMLPSGLKFDYKNQFKIKTQSRPNLVQDVDYLPDNDNKPGGQYPLGSAYSACKATGAQCLIVEFNAPGLGPTDSLVFTQGILKGSVPALVTDLSGSPITFALLPSAAGSTTTSQFIATSQLVVTGTGTTATASASSQSTSNLLPPPVVTNPQVLGPPCTPFWDADGNPSCKFDFIVVDGDPSNEGGQPN